MRARQPGESALLLDRGAFARAGEITFQGATLRVIGREDFITMKAIAGSAQDLADAEATRPATIPP